MDDLGGPCPLTWFEVCVWLTSINLALLLAPYSDLCLQPEQQPMGCVRGSSVLLDCASECRGNLQLQHEAHRSCDAREGGHPDRRRKSGLEALSYPGDGRCLRVLDYMHVADAG